MKRKAMKTHHLCLILVGCLILLSSRPCFTGDNAVMRTQGLINPGGNLKAGYLFVNEMRIYLDSSTQILDHRGGVLQAGDLKPKRWVYLEIEKEPARNALRARRIYLLPHYVSPEKKRQFAFMK